MVERWWHRRELQRTAQFVPESVRARHVGIIMDGNRRWARRHRLTASDGHRIGAEHVANLLRWSEKWSIGHLSVYVLSADNIRKRDRREVENLFHLLATTVPNAVTRTQEWSLHLSGDLNLVPEPSRSALTDAVAATVDRPRHVTMAIGYDPRRDILEGIRGALRAGSGVEVDDVSRHLSGGPVKDIDLVIRTGGDRRISGFFPWQATKADIFSYVRRGRHSASSTSPERSPSTPGVAGCRLSSRPTTPRRSWPRSAARVDQTSRHAKLARASPTPRGVLRDGPG